MIKQTAPSQKESPFSKLKPKTKAYVDLLDSDPKISQTEAYVITHKTTNRNSAKVQASQVLTKPNVILYRKKHLSMSRDNVVNLANKAKSEAVRLQANLAIQNRELGTPVQQIKTTSESITLNIDLTGQSELITDTD